MNGLIPIEHGGQRVITTELLAQVYETSTNNIKNNFNRNKENFKEGIHYFLLKGDALRAFKREVTDNDLATPGEVTESNLVARNANQLYLWTERGASRHCKILDTPKAWEQFDNLEETYFMVKEQRKTLPPRFDKTESQLAAETKRAAAMILNAKNRTAERFQKLWDRANVKPEYQAMALGSLFAEDGVDLPRIALQGTKVTYDKGTIAEKLGVYSKVSGGKVPHALAIGAIIAELDIDPDERESVPYSRNGHDGTDFQYTESVIDKVRSWLEVMDWPVTISNGSKTFNVVYRGRSEGSSNG